MWSEYVTAPDTQEVINLLVEKGDKARLIAGATDLILELERGMHKGVKTIIDITRIPGLDQIWLDADDCIHIGPLVTHNQCVASKLIREKAYPLARACWEVGAPQIRNRGTIAGNLITASPANDTITPLMALGAWVELTSSEGVRRVALKDFYMGVRRTVIHPQEMLSDIVLPAMKSSQRGTFVKLGLRRVQSIAVVNLAIILTFHDGTDAPDSAGATIAEACITLGSVAPTIIHAHEAGDFLKGKEMSEATIEQAAELVKRAAQPIDDIRGSAAYRREMVRVLTRRGLTALWKGKEKVGFPPNPVYLWGKTSPEQKKELYCADRSIEVKINGRKFKFSTGHDRTLLHVIRDEAGLTGTKEGCSEGECGACTIFLDGKAVMACLIPAPQAHGSEITTIEGLADSERLHPVQEAFIQNGAVQCGYCTPGFIMSAAKLLEEEPHPTDDQIRQSISGNLCRCTGYYKIIKAIEDASKLIVQ